MRYLKGEMLSSGKYKVNRKLPVVKDPESEDPARALLAIKYLNSGVTVQIKGTKITSYMGIDMDLKTGLPVKRKMEQRWYKIKGGYIKEIALMGAEIERV